MPGEKKGLGLAAAAGSDKSEKSSGEDKPNYEKMFDDACDELMSAAEKKDSKRFKRALRAALKTARDE